MTESGGSPDSGSRRGRKRGRRGRGGAGASTAPDAAPRAGTAAPAGIPRRTRVPKVEETSAGGLVIDRSGSEPKAVLIARHDRRGRLVWSLPKGHLEEGETPEDAALREVQEETGITGRILVPLGVIDFWFMAENRRIHKTVHHYLMEASGGELSDEDAEVVEVAWVPLAGIRDRLAYADERRLMDRLPDLLADAG
ncbi:MAG: NUDIX hydrolase [Candidatus Nanopelagicales bacterium]